MNHAYFKNTECKYYPCHNIDDLQCNFCYCPLYHIECKGKYTLTINGIKDCSKCLIPHQRQNFDMILSAIIANNDKTKQEYLNKIKDK